MMAMLERPGRRGRILPPIASPPSRVRVWIQPPRVFAHPGAVLFLRHATLELLEYLDQLRDDCAVILSLHGAPDQRRMEPKRRPKLHEMVRKSTERGDMFVLLERGQGIGQVPLQALAFLSFIPVTPSPARPGPWRA